MGFATTFLQETTKVAEQLNADTIDRMAEVLAEIRQGGGRLFVIGVGGGAGHASHSVCDFRKIAGFEAYAPSDNVSELTARVNDEGWDTTYVEWLRTSRLGPKDAVLVFSVGGGDLQRNISPNLVKALTHAKDVNARVLGVVGRNGGYTAKVADVCVVVPTVNDAHVTAHTEGFQAVVWHLLISHPLLKQNAMKWESTIVARGG